MRTKLACAVVVVLTALIALPQPAPAAGRLTVYACRDVVFQDTGSGTRVTPISCSREFPTTVPYVVLFMQLEDIDSPTTLAWQLLDPSDEVYVKSQWQVTPPNAFYTWTYFFYRVLPVAATAKEIVEKNPRLQYSIIEVGAKPISEMPGQWKFKTSLSGWSQGTVTFTLKP